MSSQARWIFRFVSRDGDCIEVPAKPNCPFWIKFEGRDYGFVESAFVSNTQLSEGKFWELYRTTRRPPDPKECDAPTQAAPQSFGAWTTEKALAAAARMTGAELDARIRYDADFANALDAIQKPGAPGPLGPNNAARDVEAWTRIREARVKRYADSLKPLEDPEPRVTGDQLYFGGVGFPPTPEEKKPEQPRYPGVTRLVVHK